MGIMKSAAVAMALVWMVGTAAARDAEIFHPPQVLFASASEHSMQQVRDRIVKAAQSSGWMVLKDEPGRIELSFDKQGKHQVDIAVQYDVASYKIDYLRSKNLNYSESGGVQRIHPNYNRWIRNLIKKIAVV